MAALYHPLRVHHASFGSPAARRPLLFSAANNTRFAWSPLSLAAICLPMRQASSWDSFPCCRNPAFLSMSAHLGAEIHWLRGCSYKCGASMLRQSSSKRVGSSSTGPWGCLIGNWASCLHAPRMNFSDNCRMIRVMIVKGTQMNAAKFPKVGCLAKEVITLGGYPPPTSSHPPRQSPLRVTVRLWTIVFG